jgi:hypothetical protein
VFTSSLLLLLLLPPILAASTTYTSYPLHLIPYGDVDKLLPATQQFVNLLPAAAAAAAAVAAAYLCS